MSRFERRRTGAADPSPAGAPPTLLHGDDPFEVIGDPAQTDALWKATGARRGTPVSLEWRATLVPEGGEGPPGIGVHLADLRVGALDPEDAADLFEGLLAVMRRNNTSVAVRSRVVGGTAGPAGDRRQLEVWIYLDPIDFGFDPPALEAIRTGHSATADPGWAEIVPRDRADRVRFLRDRLKAEHAPLQRHLMFNALEDVLYRMRDSAPSAFGDYEAAAIAHDCEMPTILPALFAEFGGIPQLPTYEHLARVLHRQRRLADAYRWAMRGLELYGDHGMYPEAVDDLRSRAETCGRLHSVIRPRPAPVPVVATPGMAAGPAPAASPVPADWYPDPTHRHELRFWDGTRWTQHVSTNGSTGVDHLP